VNHSFSGSSIITNAAVGIGKELNANSAAIVSLPILGYPVYHDLHEESTVCKRLQWARGPSCASSVTLYRVDTSRPRLGQALRTAPVARQSKPTRVCHEPRFHSRPAPSLRAAFRSLSPIFLERRGTPCRADRRSSSNHYVVLDKDGAPLLNALAGVDFGQSLLAAGRRHCDRRESCRSSEPVQAIDKESARWQITELI
jgi:hypothetical protein